MDETSIIEAQRDAYRSNFLLHGDTPLGTYQNNQVTQHLRFDCLIRHLVPHIGPGTTMHDVGSGLCDLYHFLELRDLAHDVSYSGTEIVQDMIDLSLKKYPKLTLFNRNFLDPANNDRYDFVVLSGTFNLLGGVDETAWKAMCLAIIEKMFQSANKAIAFNFLTSYRTFSDPTLYYFDPREIFDFASRKLSRFVNLEASTPLYECTVTVFKKDYLAGFYAHRDLAKYFR